MNLYEVSFEEVAGKITEATLEAAKASALNLPTLVIAENFDDAYVKLAAYKNEYFSIRSLVLKQNNTKIAS